MNQADFLSLYSSLVSGLGRIRDAVDSNPDLLGCLTLEQYIILTNLIKEYSWYLEC